MRTITHPVSFWLTIVVMMVMAALIVVWNAIHIILLVLNVALLWGVRGLAIREGRHSVETTHHTH